MKVKMTEEEAEDLFYQIDNEGFNYWFKHYKYKGNDEELKKLHEEGKKSKVKEYIDKIFDFYNFY
jgi:hypothetical protein